MRFLTFTSILALMAAPAMADEIWVTNERDDTVSVIDTNTLEVIKTYKTGERRAASRSPRISPGFISVPQTVMPCR